MLDIREVQSARIERDFKNRTHLSRLRDLDLTSGGSVRYPNGDRFSSESRLMEMTCHSSERSFEWDCGTRLRRPYSDKKATSLASSQRVGDGDRTERGSFQSARATLSASGCLSVSGPGRVFPQSDIEIPRQRNSVPIRVPTGWHYISVLLFREVASPLSILIRIGLLLHLPEDPRFL